MRPATPMQYAACLAAAAALAFPCLAVGGETPAEAGGERLFSQWLSLYVAGQKVGYETLSVYRLPPASAASPGEADGPAAGGSPGYRFTANTFLKTRADAPDARYVKTIEAVVDADGRPRSLDCRVALERRSWHVTGERRGERFALRRSVGAETATADVALQEGLTFRTWTVPATFLGKAERGGTARWMVLDESLGAVLPEPALVRILGPQTVPTSLRESLSGTAMVEVQGAEVIAHLVDGRGRRLRSVWQSAPLVAEGASFSEARRLDAPDGPRGPDIPGLEAGRYANSRMGYSLYVPPYPFVAAVLADAGTVSVADLTDGSSVTLQPAMDPRLASMHAAAEDLLGLADLVHQQWAARFDACDAGPPQATQLGGRPARAVEGTARLGCTTLHFRNVFVVGEGFAYLVSAVSPDRPLQEKRILTDGIVKSLRLEPPAGRLPIRTSGNRLAIPYYGIELERPSDAWKIPRHLGGPETLLELVREDRAGAAVLRVLAPRAGESFADFAADRAGRAAETFGIAKPEPQPALLAGRDALQFSYEGNLLAGRAAEGRAVYVPLASQVLELVLIGQKGDAGARADLDHIRESLRIAAAPEPKDQTPPPPPRGEDAP
ncbi:MAG TPA: hypothetical protein VMY35_19995 [Phycisphaerae bacterium]|nr:hypothetical protein [Phycisphaerae bacterium]